MAFSSGVARVLVAAFLAANLSTVFGAIIGQLYCSTCGAGPYNALVDIYLPNVQVTVTCTVSNPSYLLFKTATFSGTATTDGSGVFVAPLSGGSYPVIGIRLTIDQILNAYLFTNGLASNGLLPGAGVVGCQVSASGTPCSVISYNSGVCAGGSVTAGNGNSGTNVALAPTGSLTNLVLGGAAQTSNTVAPTICLTYPTKPASCAVSPAAAPTSPPGVKGDPHFSGADGSHFDFTGRPNATFCLISDAHLHVNALYFGRYATDTQTDSDPGNDKTAPATKALTWIREVGVLWGHHTVRLAAREGARWQYESGYMALMEVDGEEVKLNSPGDTVWVPEGTPDTRVGDNRVSITWVAAKEKSGDDLIDVYEIKVANVMTMRVLLRPEIALLRTPTCGLVHMSLEWPVLSVSEGVHGVLGQTYRSDFKGRLAAQNLGYSELLQTEVVPGENAEGFLDGGVDDYVSSSLLRSDCSESRFTRAMTRDSDTALARELSLQTTKKNLKVSRKIWFD